MTTNREQKSIIRRSWLPAASVTAAVLAVSAAGIAPASAGGGDVVRRGACSGSAHWKLKAKPDNGRIEVEGEVDSNHNGQTWHWRILHDGSVSARGTSTTKGPSGSFTVTRRVVNAKGVDTIGWRARNAASGQVCRGSLRI